MFENISESPIHARKDDDRRQRLVELKAMWNFLNMVRKKRFKNASSSNRQILIRTVSREIQLWPV